MISRWVGAPFAILFLTPFAARAQTDPAAAPAAATTSTSGSLAPTGPATNPANSANLGDLSLEELLNVDLKVFSVSRRAEDLGDASAAIYAVTAEEIRRVGATSIPEALRVVPGLHVARLDANSWAISARDFNGRFNNKLLVLMDGRQTYTPLFGGVFWDVNDTLLNDLSQIEVIRGPGGTLWGSNAVNGVINITTKSADHTQGLFVSAGGGTEERAYGAARYGGQLGQKVFYRAYGKFDKRDDFVTADNKRANDGWYSGRAGFRIDSNPGGDSSFTLQGDGYHANERTEVSRDILVPPYKEVVPAIAVLNGENLIGRWNRKFSAASRLQVQGYLDRTERDDVRGYEVRNTGDLDIQESLDLAETNSLVVGGGVHATDDHWHEGISVALFPRDKIDKIFNLYAQDEWRLAHDRLRLVLGSKFEHNDFTGFEFQPTARLTWKITGGNTFWTAFSRAVRTPDRIERDCEVAYKTFPPAIPGTAATYVIVVGNKNLKSEDLYAAEAGYRFQAAQRVSFDLAGYYNHYDRLINVNDSNAGTPFTRGPDTYVPVPFTDEPGGTVTGAELAATWIVVPHWTLSASYAYLKAWLGPASAGDAVSDPPTNVSLRSYLDLTEGLSIDGAWYYVDHTGLGAGRVRPYNRADLGVTLKRSKYELAIWGQNLLADHHAEDLSTFLFQSTVVQRGAYARLSAHF